MKKATLLFLVTSFFVLTSCVDSKNKKEDKKDNIETFWVNSYRKSCDAGAGKMNCLMISSAEELHDSISWDFFYSNIKNFRFKPGYFQQIKVEKTALEVTKVPADASAIAYAFLEVLQEQKDNRFLLNDIWVVENIFNNQLKTTIRHPRVEINLAKMNVYGTDGCNNFNGSILKFTQNQIQFSKLASTKKACFDQDVSIEFYEALAQVRSYEHKNLELTFYDQNKTPILELKKID